MNEETIRKIVRETVRETLTGLGFATDDPHEAQSDLLYLRKIRRGSEEMGRRIRVSFIALAVPTVLYLIWQGISQDLIK